jgi:hypothetical protein
MYTATDSDALRTCMYYTQIFSMIDGSQFCGAPRTPEEWAALAKMANGNSALSKDELRKLFMLGLVERQLGRVCLTQHGRATLGLPG